MAIGRKFSLTLVIAAMSLGSLGLPQTIQADVPSCLVPPLIPIGQEKSSTADEVTPEPSRFWPLLDENETLPNAIIYVGLDPNQSNYQEVLASIRNDRLVPEAKDMEVSGFPGNAVGLQEAINASQEGTLILLSNFGLGMQTCTDENGTQRQMASPVTGAMYDFREGKIGKLMIDSKKGLSIRNWDPTNNPYLLRRSLEFTADVPVTDANQIMDWAGIYITNSSNIVLDGFSMWGGSIIVEQTSGVLINDFGVFDPPYAIMQTAAIANGFTQRPFNETYSAAIELRAGATRVEIVDTHMGLVKLTQLRKFVTDERVEHWQDVVKWTEVELNWYEAYINVNISPSIRLTRGAGTPSLRNVTFYPAGPGVTDDVTIASPIIETPTISQFLNIAAEKIHYVIFVKHIYEFKNTRDQLLTEEGDLIRTYQTDPRQIAFRMPLSYGLNALPSDNGFLISWNQQLAEAAAQQDGK